MSEFLQAITVILLLVLILQRQLKLSTLRRIEQKMSELTDAVAAVANDVTELQAASQRVIDLLTQPDPDVAAAVAALQAADAQFDAVRDALNAAGTTPEPPPEG